MVKIFKPSFESSLSYKKRINDAYLIFQVLRFGSLLLINVIMAKSHLKMEDLGRFESFTFYTSIISFFWINGINQTLLSMSGTDKTLNTTNKVICNTALLIFLISFILSAIILSGMYFLSENMIPGLKPSDYYLFSLYMFIYPLGFMVESVLLIRKKFKLLVNYGLFVFLLTLLLVPAPSYWGFRLEYSIYGLIVLAVLKCIFLIYLLKRSFSSNFDKEIIKKIISTATPLVLSALIAGSAMYIDGLIISLNFDNQTFAIFRYGAREFPLFPIVSSSFGISILPLIANRNELHSALKQIKEHSSLLIKKYFSIAIILLCISQFAFKYMFNPNFVESYIIFDIYLLLVISRFLFPGPILIGFQKNKFILWVSLFELFINIAFSLLFVSWFGFTGVAFGTLIAYIAEKAVLAVLVKRELKIPYESYIPIRLLFSFSLVVLFAFFVKHFLILI